MLTYVVINNYFVRPLNSNKHRNEYSLYSVKIWINSLIKFDGIEYSLHAIDTIETHIAQTIHK